MNRRVAAANADWEARAIEACKDHPLVLNGTLCVICMCPLPDCLCAASAERHGIPLEEYHGEADAQLREAEPPPRVPFWARLLGGAHG